MYKKNETPPSFYSHMASSKKLTYERSMQKRHDSQDALYDQSVKTWKAICLSGEVGGIVMTSQTTDIPNAPEIVTLGDIN